MRRVSRSRTFHRGSFHRDVYFIAVHFIAVHFIAAPKNGGKPSVDRTHYAPKNVRLRFQNLHYLTSPVSTGVILFLSEIAAILFAWTGTAVQLQSFEMQKTIWPHLL